MKPSNFNEAHSIQDRLRGLAKSRRVLARIADPHHTNAKITISTWISNEEYDFDLRLFKDGPLDKFKNDCLAYIEEEEKRLLEKMETL